MAVYRFKIAFEDHEDIYREVELKSDQKFIDLYDAVLKSIAFESDGISSFYMSTDNWKKGTEISSKPKNDKAGKPLATMDKALLKSYIADPHQKIYFVLESETLWSFHIELVKIIPKVDDKLTYPFIRKSIGEAPKQFKIVIPPDDLEDELLLDDTDVTDVDVDEFVTTEEIDAEDTDGLEGEEGEEELGDVEMADDDSVEEEN
jgi:hypothetical protein